MAIDSADKRRASIGFGMPQSAGTLIPSGATSAFRRGCGLGLYPVGTVTDPASGWTATTRTRLAIATGRNRLAIPTAKERVWIAEGK